MGENQKALNYFDRSLHLEANHGPTLLNRAKALFLLGYHRQGLAQAATLKNHSDRRVADQAEALILAYS